VGFLANPLVWKGITTGVSLLGGWLGGKKAEKNAMQRSPEEAAALTGASNSANALNTTGTQLTQAGMPAVNKSLGYYSTLLGGNRAAMSLATAAPRASITDTYRGAERNLEQQGVQGAGRDQAVAGLARDKAGNIARLTTGVQPAAANALADLGTNLTSQGGQQQNAAGSLFANLLGKGFENRKYAREEGGKASSAIGSLLFDVLSGIWKPKGSSGGGAGIPGLPGGQAGPF
jgi:hypothetical protein